MCDQSAEQQRDGFTGRQEQAMGTFRCRRGLPYEAKSLHSGEEREYDVRVGVPNRKCWLVSHRHRSARTLDLMHDHSTGSPMPICVLGMHRSGTSSLTGSLQQAGVYLGDVITDAPHNEKGNRENLTIRALNDDVLACSEGSWCSLPRTLAWRPEHETRRDAIIEAFANTSGRWGFKDPRTLLTLPFWLAAETSFALVGTFRHPIAVTRSLRARSPELSFEQALDLWETYNRILLGLVESQPLPLINFDLDETAYREQLHRLLRRLDLDSDSVYARAPFFDSRLRHQEVDKRLCDEALPPQVRTVFDRLRACSEAKR